MALEITTIPVLTGDVAEKFEAQATKAYQNLSLIHISEPTRPY